MKKIITFLLAAGIIFGLASCNDKLHIVDLTLNSRTLEIDKAEIATISIETGNGKYVVESSDNMIAKVAISGTTVAILGVEGGSAIVTVTDEHGKTETINVTVSFSVPNTSTFVWNKEAIKFDNTDGYGISILENSIALTDMNVPKQFFLSWEGGMSEGDKTNGKLLIVEPGMTAEEIEEIELTSIKIVRAERLGNYMVFNDGSRGGELFFSK